MRRALVRHDAVCIGEPEYGNGSDNSGENMKGKLRTHPDGINGQQSLPATPLTSSWSLSTMRELGGSGLG